MQWFYSVPKRKIPTSIHTSNSQIPLFGDSIKNLITVILFAVHNVPFVRNRALPHMTNVGSPVLISTSILKFSAIRDGKRIRLVRTCYDRSAGPFGRTRSSDCHLNQRRHDRNFFARCTWNGFFLYINC